MQVFHINSRYMCPSLRLDQIHYTSVLSLTPYNYCYHQTWHLCEWRGKWLSFPGQWPLRLHIIFFNLAYLSCHNDIIGPARRKRRNYRNQRRSSFASHRPLNEYRRYRRNRFGDLFYPNRRSLYPHSDRNLYNDIRNLVRFY